MSDFRNPNDPLRRDFGDDPELRSRNATWGWIAAAVFIVLVLAVIFGVGRGSNPGDTNTAYNSPPTASSPMTPHTNPMSPPAGTPTPAAPTPAPVTPAPAPAGQ